MQFEDLGDNAKAAIRLFRNFSLNYKYKRMYLDVCLQLHNIIPEGEQFNFILQLAEKKNYWIKDK